MRELTFSCDQRRPLLVEDQIRKLFCVAVGRAIERHDFRLAAFALMAEHVHLLVQPRRVDSRVTELLFAIKQPASFRIRQHLQQ